MGKKSAQRPLLERATRSVQQSLTRLRHARAELYYRMRSTPRGAAILRTGEFLATPLEIRERRRAAREFNAPAGGPVMTRDSGWAPLSAAALPDLDRVLETCRELFAAKRPHLDDHEPERRPGDSKNTRRKRQFLRNILTDGDLAARPELVDVALSDEALGIATTYLGAVPFLNRIDLLYSTPREDDALIRSQLFHVDPEGLTQVKFFINVYDVGEPQGPFTFIPAADSERTLHEIRILRHAERRPHVGRYTDEEVAAIGGTSAIVSLTGPAGTGVAIDTSRCLHLGSRVAPGAFRLVLYVQYCSTRERGNVFDVQRYRDDPIRYLAVRHSSGAAAQTLAAPDQMAG
jgi:hypothetical protein